ncbi:DUF433 domain-containing protein [Urbifossiella limnaea]|uniref:DUF433 domain-containing protein n=1 Tax=Urbifossiella limnaea TaxID=2528023 RepID=A0A517XM71_9BACT|nr:DUF433 domain-containing protein [Urbifossiella limnaea]QDU18601.1 hypothetical protein ETAA1_04940 [Urbifossiella limnaea]
MSLGLIRPAHPASNPVTQRTPTRYPLRDGADPAAAGVYGVSEAAGYLHLPARTVRDWAFGREYPTGGGRARSVALIEPADPNGRRLSFLNLVEIHIIASLRRVHRVKAQPVRRAIAYLKKEFGSRRPLLDHHMLTDGTSLFVERYGSLVSVSEAGQLHIRECLEAHLQRVEWDENHHPIRLYPFTHPGTTTAPRFVAINPRVRMGQPCIAGTGVPTAIIAQRHAAGDSVAGLAADYGRSAEEVEEAIRYERRAAA